MITQHQAEQEVLAKELEGWAAKLPCPPSGNWKWAPVEFEFDSIFDERITALVTRPGDTMTRQQLKQQYEKTTLAVEQMDNLCTDPRCWSKKRAQSEDAWMAAHDGIREARKEVRQLANLIRDGFAQTEVDRADTKEQTCADNTVSAAQNTGQEINDTPVTLREFMGMFCQLLEKNLRESRVKALQSASRRGVISLPKHVGHWKSGQSKKYSPHALVKAWPKYREELPNLPDLKPEFRAR